jgi:hypothetical protein
MMDAAIAQPCDVCSWLCRNNRTEPADQSVLTAGGLLLVRLLLYGAVALQVVANALYVSIYLVQYRHKATSTIS